MSSTEERVESAVSTFFRSLEDPFGAPIVVALSGGCDSSALAIALTTVHRARSQILCAHFDHGLRSEDERERERTVVLELGRRLNVPLVTAGAARGEIVSSAKGRGSGIEDAARAARYRFLSGTAREYGARFIATGHHHDDLIEGIVMQFLLGGGPSAVAGMPSVRTIQPGLDVIRPFLGVRRSDLSRYCAEHGVTVINDSSNSDTRIARNAVRARVIPEMRAFFPGFEAAIQQSASRLGELQDFIETEARERITWEKTSRGVRTERIGFFGTPRPIREAAMYLVARDVARGPKRRISRRFLRTIPEHDPGGDRVVTRSAGVVVRTAGSWLFWERDIASTQENGYLFSVASGVSFSVLTEIGSVWGKAGDNREGVAYRIQVVPSTQSIIIRSRRPGDTVRTCGGSKPMKKVLAELGIPEFARDIVPILEDSSGIFAVLGAPFGFRDVFSREFSLRGSRQDGCEIFLSVNGVLGER
ncbi:MAG: tRNA lysidine(34) synthetase TilS [Spirochaetaceae bacterium]|nr:MAG: tRNA lysidine(34) synthetase TilS [Spirochaetaceae bacterium]